MFHSTFYQTDVTNYDGKFIVLNPFIISSFKLNEIAVHLNEFEMVRRKFNHFILISFGIYLDFSINGPFSFYCVCTFLELNCI